MKNGRFYSPLIVLVISASMLPALAWAVNSPSISTTNAPQPVTAAVAEQPASVIPIPKPAEKWQQRHQAINDRVKQGNIDMILAGVQELLLSLAS